MRIRQVVFPCVVVAPSALQRLFGAMGQSLHPYRPILQAMLVTGLAFSCTAFAQSPVPTQLSFTARLVDNGAPVNGERDFIFRLFPTQLGGSEIWFETRTQVTVVNGDVNLDLGALSPLTDAVFTGQTLYLEVTVAGTVLAPRTAVLSVPYALRSTVAGRIGALSEPDIQKRVSNECGLGTAIRRINTDGTVTCQASAVTFNDAGVSGISSVTGSAGLLGGGATGDLSLSVDFAGSGTANTVAHSDHHHAGTYLPKGAALACTGVNNRVSGIDPTSGNVVCAADLNSGGTVTSIVAGTGLTGGTITNTGTIAIASTVQNWSAQPSCPTGNYVRSISASGIADCSPDSNTSYSVATSSANGLMSAADKTKLDQLGNAGLNCVTEFDFIEQGTAVALYWPSPAKRAELFQYGWLCWNRSDDMAKVSPLDDVTLNPYWNTWGDDRKVCGRINLISGAGDTNRTFMAGAMGAYWYALRYLDGTTNTWHGRWFDGTEGSGAVGAGDRWTIYTCH